MSKANGKFYLFANWKMYLDFDESNILANALAAEAKKFPANVAMAIFPSALALYPAGQVLRDVGIGTGAQNVYWVDKGGYTGEVSAQMFANAGCEYALVGHSERRHVFHETNHEVRQKMEAALAAGLAPVLCVGETEHERDGGQAEEVVEIQVRAAFDGIKWPTGRKLIVAYEPVWAIGTGNNCSRVDAQKMHVFIKKILSKFVPTAEPVLLYGGSVRASNVADYLNEKDINGVLVGGASAKLDSWMEIVQNVEAI